MKILRYLLREFKNLFEFYLIPLLAVILPHKTYYPIYKFVCFRTFLYNVYSEESYKKAGSYIKNLSTKIIWERNVKLLHLIDITDCWLAIFRPKKLQKLLTKKGSWAEGNGFLALNAHWGTGFSSLLDLKISGKNPHFVYSDSPVSFKQQGFLEKIYRKIRRKYVNKISGSFAIPTSKGMSYKRILDVANNKGVPVILYDAPIEKEYSRFNLNIFFHEYPIASGTINLTCKEGVSYQLFSIKLDFATGFKCLRIHEEKNTRSESKLVNDLSIFLEKLLEESPEQWYLWKQAKLLLESQNRVSE